MPKIEWVVVGTRDDLVINVEGPELSTDEPLRLVTELVDNGEKRLSDCFAVGLVRREMEETLVTLNRGIAWAVPDSIVLLAIC